MSKPRNLTPAVKFCETKAEECRKRGLSREAAAYETARADLISSPDFSAAVHNVLARKDHAKLAGQTVEMQTFEQIRQFLVELPAQADPAGVH